MYAGGAEAGGAGGGLSDGDVTDGAAYTGGEAVGGASGAGGCRDGLLRCAPGENIAVNSPGAGCLGWVCTGTAGAGGGAAGSGTASGGRAGSGMASAGRVLVSGTSVEDRSSGVSCFTATATGSGIGMATGIDSAAREATGGAMSDGAGATLPGGAGGSGRNICVNSPGGAGAAGETAGVATAAGGGGRTKGSGSGALPLAAGGIGIASGGIGIGVITGGSGAAAATAVRASSQSANMFSPSSARVITVHPRSVTVVAIICAASGPLNCARRAVIDARASGDESISTWASTESPATVSSAMYVRMPSCCAMAIDNR